MAYDQYGNYVPTSSGGGDAGLWAGIGTGALSGVATGASIGGPWGALVGGLVGAGAGLISGEAQKKKANALLKQNQFPIQPIPQGIEQNAQQANRLALQGLPSAQYEQAQKNVQRQQQDAIVAAQSRKAGMATIGNIDQSGQDAYQNLSAADTQARMANIQSAYQQNQVLGQYSNNAFDWNSKSRYLQNYSYAMNLLGSGNQNIMRSIDTGTAGLVRGISGGAFNGLFGGVAGRNPQPDQTTLNPNIAASIPNLPMGVQLPRISGNSSLYGGSSNSIGLSGLIPNLWQSTQF